MSNIPVKQLDDKVHTARIVTVGVVSLLVFGVGIFWAVTIQERTLGTIKSIGPKAVEAHKQEVGIVFQPLFTTEPLSAERVREEREALEMWGWADAEHKHVRVPVEQAMDLMAKGGKW